MNYGVDSPIILTGSDDQKGGDENEKRILIKTTLQF